MTAALLLATALAAAPSPRVGVDVTIAEPTVGTVVAVAGKVRVASEVRGDVIALLGGVPAPGAVSELTGVLGSLTGWLASSLFDAVAAARGGATAVQALLAAEGFSPVFWLLLAAAGGGVGVRALVRRRAEARR